jgi:hypothetical protein
MTNFLQSLIFLLTLGFSNFALADTTVDVLVRGAAEEGQVTLRSDSGSFFCQTKAKKCTLKKVPAGRYTAQFKDSKGTASRAQNVVVPDATQIQLIIYGGS